MVMQLSPMCTVILAYFILKERITVKQLIVLLLAFSAVTLVIIGGDENTMKTYQANILAVFMLFSNPIAVTIGVISMR